MEDYYCPKCLDKLERISGCGTVGYMCNTCKSLVSKGKILNSEQMKDKLADDATEKFLSIED